jgi:hypothetical protein
MRTLQVWSSWPLEDQSQIVTDTVDQLSLRKQAGQIQDSTKITNRFTGICRKSLNLHYLN